MTLNDFGSDEIKKATDIKDVFYAIGEGRPLKIEELDRFYCDTDKVRTEVSPRAKLARNIRNYAKAGKNGHILFVGARGAGKSTELNHLQKDLEPNIAVLNYSVIQELDPMNISYIELFIVTMEKLLELAQDRNLVIPDDFLDRIIGWTQSKEISNVTEKHFSAEANAELKAKVGVPYLLGLFLGLKATAKASRSFKETLKSTIEPRLSELIKYCNELITEIRLRLIENGTIDLLIIIEDLDKISPTVAREVFLHHADQLVQLQANMVYSYPVALYYNISFNTIKNYFSDVIELPMIKVSNKAGQPFEEGILVLTDIVHTRMEANLFESPDILKDMILACGGVLRDLFRMIKDAADAAEDRSKDKIGVREYEYAYRELQKSYDHTIADYYDDEYKIAITAQQFYDVLVALTKSTDKQPQNTKELLQLRQNLCVLTYNGENWSDVHPVVKEILKSKGLL